MDRKPRDFAHGFPQVFAQSGVGKDKILELVAFEQLKTKIITINPFSSLGIKIIRKYNVFVDGQTKLNENVN